MRLRLGGILSANPQVLHRKRGHSILTQVEKETWNFGEKFIFETVGENGLTGKRPFSCTRKEIRENFLADQKFKTKKEKHAAIGRRSLPPLSMV